MTKVKEVITIITSYVRVSTKAEAQLTSFENQPEFFKIVLKQPRFKNYRHTPNFYCDYGISGTKLHREGFIQMLEDAGLVVREVKFDSIPHPIYSNRLIPQMTFDVYADPSKKPKFNEIWVKTTSRFARNINAYDIVRALLKKGVSVYFISDDLNSKKPEDLPRIRKKFDEDMAYSENLSRQRQIVQTQYETMNRLNGCPFGYDYHPKTKTTEPFYTINPKDGETVKRIFEMCAEEGIGAKVISKRLAAEGRLTKQGKPFSTSTIQKILTNEKYMGLNNVGKLTSGVVFEKLTSAAIREDYKDRLQESDGLPAIVSKELWYKAQESKKERQIKIPTSDKPVGINQPKHLLKDLLTCGYCGNHFIYDNNGGNGCFRCSTKRNQGVEACSCANVYLSYFEEFIERLQNGELHQIITTDFENTILSLIALIEHTFDILKDPSTADLSEEAIAIREQLQRNADAVDNLLDMLTNPNYDSATIKERTDKKMAEITIENKALEKRLAELETSEEEKIDFLKKLFSAAFNEITLYESKKKSYTQEEAYQILSKIKVFGTSKPIGGRTPKPILVPTLIAVEQAQALSQLGIDKFHYKIRNLFPSYEAPQEGDTLSALDREDSSLEEKQAMIEKTTKSNWPTSESKYLYAPTRFTPDLGIEERPVITQMREYLEGLFAEFQSFVKT